MKKNSKITYEFYDIKWDTEGEEVDLPEKASYTVNEDFDAENEGADLLSDQYGWLVISFSFKKR